METGLVFLVLLTCFSLIETLEACETCLGIRRKDSSYDFNLPDAVVENVQDVDCDAEWTIDQFTAVLDGESAHYSHPFKNVTRHGISVSYCPFFVKFHISCPKYTRELLCSCINSTSIDTVFSTTLPSGGNPIKTDSSVRQHYCAIAVAAIFALALIILAFHICRTNSTAENSPNEQKQPGSVE